MNKELTTVKEIINCPLGLYRIYWQSGGSSLAAVGNLHCGTRWIAPVNWTCKKGSNPTSNITDIISEIEKMELIEPI
jgi:hypothetical protein